MRVIIIDAEKELRELFCELLQDEFEDEGGATFSHLETWKDYTYEEGDVVFSDIRGVGIEDKDDRANIILMSGCIGREGIQLYKPFGVEDMVNMLRDMGLPL